MADLSFEVQSAHPVSFAAAPLMALRMNVRNNDETENIQSVILRCQIQIETQRRRYQNDEKNGLRDLFGETSRWDRTLRPLLWTNATVIVPPFQGSAIVDLQLPCSFDFNVASTKYFAALKDGEIPLTLMFSGTVFYSRDDNRLQVEQIPWDREARFQLPVKVWQEVMDHYYPNTAWLCLRRDVFDKLAEFKTNCGITSWEEALERIIPAPETAQEIELIIEGGLPS